MRETGSWWADVPFCRQKRITSHTKTNSPTAHVWNYVRLNESLWQPHIMFFPCIDECWCLWCWWWIYLKYTCFFVSNKLMLKYWWWTHNSIRFHCVYYFSLTYKQQTLIARPDKRAMGCLLWVFWDEIVSFLVYLCCMQHYVLTCSNESRMCNFHSK